MKKLLIIGIVLLSVFLIYLNNLDRKIYYMSLGDSLANGLNSYQGTVYSYSDYIKNFLENKKILEVYNKSFVKNNFRIIDLINMIEDNVKETENKKKSIKNGLIKADILTLSIGLNDLLGISNNISYELIDEIFIDMEKLFILVRKYCKEDVMIIGFYNTVFIESKYINYANQSLKNLSDLHKIDYIDISDISPIVFENPKSLYPMSSGYKFISEKIIQKIKDNVLKR